MPRAACTAASCSLQPCCCPPYCSAACSTNLQVMSGDSPSKSACGLTLSSSPATPRNTGVTKVRLVGRSLFSVYLVVSHGQYCAKGKLPGDGGMSAFPLLCKGNIRKCAVALHHVHSCDSCDKDCCVAAVLQLNLLALGVPASSLVTTHLHTYS